MNWTCFVIGVYFYKINPLTEGLRLRRISKYMTASFCGLYCHRIRRVNLFSHFHSVILLKISFIFIICMSAKLMAVCSVSFLSCMLPFMMSWLGLCVCLFVCLTVHVYVYVSRAEALPSQGEEGTVVVEEQVESTTTNALGAGHEGGVGLSTENPEEEEEQEEPERLEAECLINLANVLQLVSFS